MTDPDYEQLKAKAETLWNEYMALKKPTDEKGREWSDAVTLLKREAMRREIYAQVARERGR